MTTKTIPCSICQVTLRNASDTFGDWDFPLCWPCHIELSQLAAYDFVGSGQPVTHYADDQGEITLIAPFFDTASRWR